MIFGDISPIFIVKSKNAFTFFFRLAALNVNATRGMPNEV